MTPNEMLDEMLVLVVNKFKGKTDKQGMPYVLHCLKVMHYGRTEDLELQCIMLGHDLVEDTDVTFSLLREMGFSERIIAGIRALTRMPGETEEEYINKVKENIDAVRCKLADLRHNSDIRRLKGITEKDISRMKKYHAAYVELKNHYDRFRFEMYEGGRMPVV